MSMAPHLLLMHWSPDACPPNLKNRSLNFGSLHLHEASMNIKIVPTGLEPVTSALPDGGHMSLTNHIRTARYHCATGLRNPKGFLELIFEKLLRASPDFDKYRR